MNKKFRNFTLLMLACLMMPFLMAVTSCGSDKKNKNVEFDSINIITKEDTTRVFDMTKKFMEAMKNNQVDTALNMLRIIKNDSVQRLNDEELARMRKQFSLFPVLDYEIVISHFQNRDSADATYRYRFMDNPTTDPNYPVHTTLTLAVQKKWDEYVMTLVDEYYLDRLR